jgi:hypothetical protein
LKVVANTINVRLREWETSVNDSGGRNLLSRKHLLSQSICLSVVLTCNNRKNRVHGSLKASLETNRSQSINLICCDLNLLIVKVVHFRGVIKVDAEKFGERIHIVIETSLLVIFINLVVFDAPVQWGSSQEIIFYV